MKKFVILIIVLALNASITVFANESKTKESMKTLPAKTENKLSETEIKRINDRIEEIRKMDKSDLSVKEKRELRKELREMKESVKKDGGYIYISAGTLIIILLVLLLIV